MRLVSRQHGYMLLVGILLVMVIAATVFVAQGEYLVRAIGERYSKTKQSETAIQDALIRFASIYHRLPCPADPAGASNPGWPNGDATLANPHTACTYPTGVVPWQALGLTQEQVVDEWGKMISYRVFDGTFGLTQAKGASALDCDTDNGATPEIEPTYGLCHTGHDTLAASFLMHASYIGTPSPGSKGLVVDDFGQSTNSIAFLLISHGPSGLGAYLPNGIRMTLPDAGARDYPNTQGPTAIFKRLAGLGTEAPGSTGHFDDVVTFIRIADLLTQAKLGGRDWPEASLPSLTAATTADMTSPSTNPASPHFMTSGESGSGQEFVATTADGQPAAGFGSAIGAYAGCLWWPTRIYLVDGPARRNLTFSMDFAAIDNPSDRFAGFTMAFVSGSDALGPPLNATCGTTFFTRTATQGAQADQVVVSDVSGIYDLMLVTGTGIAPGATVDYISGMTVDLSADNTATVNNPVQFANARLIRRDMGWAGGMVASYANRFAIEFDTNSDTVTYATPPVPSANDATYPHLAIDYGGVTHGVDAESCVMPNYGAGCNRPSVDPFPAPTPATRTATGSSGTYVITITDAAGSAGALHGMPVWGAGIAGGATVTGISGNEITLSAQNTGPVTSATFGSVSSSNFMQNGLSVFHTIRAELTPEACNARAATGGLGSSAVTVSSAAGIAIGMNVFGAGIAPGATVTSIAGTTVNLSRSNTGAVNGTLTFAWPPATNRSATGTSGQYTITVSPDARGLAIGMAASGTGIANGATVTAISGDTLTLSIANSTAVSGTISYSWPAATAKSSNGTAGDTAVVVSDVTGIARGMMVYGAGVGAGAEVVSVDATTLTITLSAVNGSNFGSALVTFAPRQIKPSAAAVGSTGTSTIAVANPLGIVPGMSAVGTGIASGAVVIAVTGTNVTLSAVNTADVGGNVRFSPPPWQVQTLVKTWTLSNGGCNASPSVCASLKNIDTPFGEYLNTDNQALHAVSCLPIPTPSTAFDSLYFGMTTANRTTGTVSGGNNLLFRQLRTTSKNL